MAVNAKKTKSTKTRVAKKVKKKSTDKKLFIALGVLVIVIVAVAGIAYYRQSQAAGAKIIAADEFYVKDIHYSNGYTDSFKVNVCDPKRPEIMKLGIEGDCSFAILGTFNSGATRWVGDGNKCYIVTKARWQKGGFTSRINLAPNDKVAIYRADGCF